jgi:hypothetical protein
MGATMRLPQETMEALSGRFASANDSRWVLGVAASDGWLAANRAYLAAMRQRGAEEMAALMEAVGIARPMALPEAVELLEMALPLWACGTRVKPLACENGSVVLEIRGQLPDLCATPGDWLAGRNCLRELAPSPGLV